jgi:hypothetical protein
MCVRVQVSETTNSHEIVAELQGTTWPDLCALSPHMAARAQALARRYGYQVAASDVC